MYVFDGYLIRYAEYLDNPNYAFIILLIGTFALSIYLFDQRRRALAFAALGAFWLLVNVSLHYLEMSELGDTPLYPYTGTHSSWASLPEWPFAALYMLGIVCLVVAVLMAGLRRTRVSSTPLGFSMAKQAEPRNFSRENLTQRAVQPHADTTSVLMTPRDR